MPMLSLCAVLATLSALPPHDPEGRLADLDRRIAAHPFDVAALLERAAAYSQLREPELALLDYERVAGIDAAEPRAARGEAETLYMLGRDAEALAHLECAMQFGDSAPDAAWLRGRLLAALGRPAAAAEAFRAALPRMTPRPEHYLELAAAVQAGDAGGAAAALLVLDEGLHRLGPAPALVQAAVEHELAVGSVARALQRVDELRQHSARQAPWLLVRADILDRAGRAAEARLERARAATEAMAPTPVGASAAVAPFASTAPAAAASLLAAPPETTLVARGSAWRYRDDNSVTGTAWRGAAFDDSAWSQGPAQLGYGDGDEVTIVGFGPSSTNRYITTWFRHTFTSAQPLFTYATLRLLRDDGAVVYLDGQELVRSNMPAGTIASTTLASTATDGAAENVFNEYSIDPALVRTGTHTLAVEVHQNAATSTDLSFDLELVAGQTAVPVTRQPYVQDVTSDGAVLHWRTATPTATHLWVGASLSAMQLAYVDATAVTEHIAVVRGLPAESSWFYGVGDAGGILVGGDPTHSFATLPPAGAVRPLRVWTLGDPGTGTAVARAVRDQYLAFAGSHAADMVLFLGDNAYTNGTDAQYQTGMFDIYGGVLQNTASWSCLGNHDALSASGTTQTGVYFDVFDLPKNGEAGGLPSGTEAYYAFDRGNVHFVCLDSQDSNRTANGAMMQWLQADLASTAAPWVVAFFHHPPYTKGTHDSDNAGDSGARMQDMRQIALPILEAHGVDLVLTGHSHTYERSYLVDGHYGLSSTFQPSMIVDRGDGRLDGDGSYAKAAAGRGVHDGAVYVVAGSSGQSGSGPLNHPAMFVSMPNAGSLVLDIDGNRLDATFVTDTGSRPDHFTIEKNARRTLLRDVPALSLGTGGTQNFRLRAGPQFAGKNYWLAGSGGISQGFVFLGLQVPIDNDAWLGLSLSLANTPVYPNSIGVLDGNGEATTAFVLPPGLSPSLAGLSFYHAYMVYDAAGPLMMSNAVRVRVEP